MSGPIINVFDYISSMIIESVVDKHNEASNGVHDEMCRVCEMAVVWMQNQLRRNETADRIFDYMNKVRWILYII